MSSFKCTVSLAPVLDVPLLAVHVFDETSSISSSVGSVGPVPSR